MSLFSSIGKAFKSVGRNIASGIGGIFGGSGGILAGQDMFTGINPIDDYTGKTTAKLNLEESRRQFDIQQKYNREQFDYQKMLNDLQMQREDTAYQRKVADMTKAGFNPILATGGSGEASSPLKAPALSTGPAPSMPDYSGGLRDIVGSVFSLLTMKKNFAVQDAQIAKLTEEKNNIIANTAKTEEETKNLRILNNYEDEYLRGRNQGQQIANEMHQFGLEVAKSKLPLELKEMQGRIDLQDKEKMLKDLESDVYKLRITGMELDNVYKGLLNSKAFKELSELDQKIQLNAIAIAMKQAEYDEYMYARGYFHDRLAGAPVGYHIPDYKSLGFPIVRHALDEVSDWVPKPPVSVDYGRIKEIMYKSPFDRSYNHYPAKSMSGARWMQYNKMDFGARSNY